MYPLLTKCMRNLPVKSLPRTNVQIKRISTWLCIYHCAYIHTIYISGIRAHLFQAITFTQHNFLHLTFMGFLACSASAASKAPKAAISVIFLVIFQRENSLRWVTHAPSSMLYKSVFPHMTRKCVVEERRNTAKRQLCN